MTFRNRLLVFVAPTIAATVALVTWTVSVTTRRAFEALDAQRTAALVAQFSREFARRGEELVLRVEGIARADIPLLIGIESARPQPDFSRFVSEAGKLASANGLDFLELVAGDGTIVSSAQWAARFGYRAQWVTEPADWKSEGAFLKGEELPDGTALALAAVRAVAVGERKVYIAAGRRLDKEFLASLVLPAGMRVLLYRNFEPRFSSAALTDAAGAIPDADSLAPLVERARITGREFTDTVNGLHGPEIFEVIPLNGRKKDLLGVLLVGSSRRDLLALVNRIRWVGLIVGGLGMLLGIALSYSFASRITRPLETLARGARTVARGEWNTRVDIRFHDEVGELATAFNTMTRQLIDQRDRLIQAERVAAWRELARRLAHELKNPLFPLQITVENLQRARDGTPEQFDEVFRESTTTLLAELANLNAIIGRFSSFAKMPQPRFEPVRLDEIVGRELKLFEAQFHGAGRAPIEAEVRIDPDAGIIDADPEQLARALKNLILNAIDAMPKGGTLSLRARRNGDKVRLEVSDTGQGLTKEECERLFTPYYTTKQHGTGLGLAIVQSVVSDHGGKISVESETGRGATFVIELPANRSDGERIELGKS